MDAAQITRFLRGYGNSEPLCAPASGQGSAQGIALSRGTGTCRGRISGVGGTCYGDKQTESSGNKWGQGMGRGTSFCGAGEGKKEGIGAGNGTGNWSGVWFGSSDPVSSRNPSEIAMRANNFEILTYEGEPVYTVDGIPCIFQSVHDTWAKVSVIRTTDFTVFTAFIGKCKGFFAHGKTVREALQDAKEKFYLNIDFEQKKAELKRLFSRSADKKLPVRTLYDWHGMLTGSCRFGRNEFMRDHTLKDDDRLTLKEFVNLTAEYFGGQKIQELLGD